MFIRILALRRNFLAKIRLIASTVFGCMRKLSKDFIANFPKCNEDEDLFVIFLIDIFF